MENTGRFLRNCFGFGEVFACNDEAMEYLTDIGEDALISRLVQGLNSGADVVVGPGDDCAVVDVGDSARFQLLKTDCLVEGVHYLSDAAAEKVGWKAIARVISDFAAMGGQPSQLLVTLVMPGAQSVAYVEKLYQGMQKCAQEFGAVISGGETSSVPTGSAAVISIAGTGWVKKAELVLRSGGQVGDRVMVTGLLGGSIHGKHLSFTPRVSEARWLTENFDLHAMMDISDGLAKDFPRLAKMSSCSFLINEGSVPCSNNCDVVAALSDGEDYELLFTVSPNQLESLKRQWSMQFPDLMLSEVGTLTELNSENQQGSGGWEHFKS